MNSFDHITTALTGRSPWPFADIWREVERAEQTNTDRIRNYLRHHGSANAATLADEADVPKTALVGALLKGDIAKGRIFRCGDRYYWNTQYDEQLQAQLNAAAELLKRNGYKVIKP